MSQNPRLSCHLLSLQDVIDELKELDEFFLLYLEAVEEERLKVISQCGLEINFQRFCLLTKAHQMLNKNLLTRFEDELDFFGRLVIKSVKEE